MCASDSKAIVCVRLRSGEFFIFPQGSVPTHQARETINFLKRGSVATRLRCGEQCGMVLLRISSRMQRLKNLKNRSTFVEQMYSGTVH